jgi:hypothetical protein
MRKASLPYNPLAAPRAEWKLMNKKKHSRTPIAHGQLNDYHDNNPALGAISKSIAALKLEPKLGVASRGNKVRGYAPRRCNNKMKSRWEPVQRELKNVPGLFGVRLTRLTPDPPLTPISQMHTVGAIALGALCF